MGNSFLAAVNFDDFLNITSKDINTYVLKNNEAALRKMYTFFRSDNKILFVTGFAGTGKKQISEQVLSYMDKETVVCRFVCTESSRLDDAELCFYKIMRKKFSSKKNIDLDALDTVEEKINHIITDKKINCVFVFYNIDSLQKENREEFLNYVYTYSGYDNVKTLIVSRIFDTGSVPKEHKYMKVLTKALSKELFENFIRDFGIKVTTSMIEQLYRLTRGYFFYACLSSKIMVNKELTINNFIIEYSNSGTKFDEYLAQKYYSLIVGTTKSAFNLFLKLRHGLNNKVLQSLGNYPENIIKMLNANYYIYKKGDLYYPSLYLKQHLERSAKEEISDEKLAAYYEGQLELPPDERDFTISRAALNDEIAHYRKTSVGIKENIIEQPSALTPINTTKKIKSEIKDENLSSKELYSRAFKLFNSYDYIKVLDILSRILSKEQNDRNLINSSYNLLAQTYAKLEKWKYALHYYKLLNEYYTLDGDTENQHKIRYETAKVYFKSYRIIEAIRELRTLLPLVKDKRIKIGCNIMLGNISISAANKELALQYYRDGIGEINSETDKSTAIELFFKYAVLSDENEDLDSAIEYYQKVIGFDEPSNKYTALAYSNLGDLFCDNELYDDAKDCFEKAYLADKAHGSEYGMYYSLSKIVDLTDKQEEETRIKNACEAKEHAIKTRDYHSIIEATIKLGDLYYDYSKPQLALKEYVELYNADKDTLDEYNFKMLKSRLEDIKVRIGDDEFKKSVPNYE